RLARWACLERRLVRVTENALRCRAAYTGGCAWRRGCTPPGVTAAQLRVQLLRLREHFVAQLPCFGRGRALLGRARSLLEVQVREVVPLRLAIDLLLLVLRRRCVRQALDARLARPRHEVTLAAFTQHAVAHRERTTETAILTTHTDTNRKEQLG